MPDIVVQHSIWAICLIVTLEEANVPLPFPGDLLLMYAGALSADSAGKFAWWLLLLTVVPSLGSYVLYEIVRRGGRPLVERYGRYFALGPRELAQSERLLQRFGWGGIAIGRSVPLLRHAVTIVCGLLGVTPRSYMLAQLVGGLANTLLFMLLGALVGPALVESFHLPRQAVRLGELLLVAAGLPLGLWWLYQRARPQFGPAARQPRVGSLLLASTAGAVALCAAWAALVVAAELLGWASPPNALAELAAPLLGRGVTPGVASALLFAGLLALCAGLGLATSRLLRRKAGAAPRPLRDAGALWALMAGAGALLLALLGAWQAGAVPLALTLALASLAFALTTAYGWALGAALAAGAQLFR